MGWGGAGGGVAAEVPCSEPGQSCGRAARGGEALQAAATRGLPAATLDVGVLEIRNSRSYRNAQAGVRTATLDVASLGRRVRVSAIGQHTWANLCLRNRPNHGVGGMLTRSSGHAAAGPHESIASLSLMPLSSVLVPSPTRRKGTATAPGNHEANASVLAEAVALQLLS